MNIASSHAAHSHHMIKRALLAVANGSEDVETVTVIDILRRGGIPLTVAKVFESSGSQAHGESEMQQVADKKLTDVLNDNFDMIILPGGGKGADTFSKSKDLKLMLMRQHEQNKLIAAICASPAQVLVPFGILKSQNATCYPSMQNQLKNQKHINDLVVMDHNLITSQGPGTAAQFAFKCLEMLKDRKEVDKVSKAMLIDYNV
eukprot:403367713